MKSCIENIKVGDRIRIGYTHDGALISRMQLNHAYLYQDYKLLDMEPYGNKANRYLLGSNDPSIHFYRDLCEEECYGYKYFMWLTTSGSYIHKVIKNQ